MKIGNELKSNVYYSAGPLEESSLSETIKEVEAVFKIPEIVASILGHLPFSELGTCTQVNKIFYSTIHRVPQLRFCLFLERAKKEVESIPEDRSKKYYYEAFVSKIIQLEVFIDIKQAKERLKKITQYRDAFSKTWIEVVKKEVENGRIEEAKTTALDVPFFYDQFLAWLEILKNEKTEANEKQVVASIEKIILKREAALAYLQLWNLVRNQAYFLEAKRLMEKELDACEKFDFWLELSKIEPTLENKQKAKEQTPLFLNHLSVFEKPPIIMQVEAALAMWEECQDQQFLEAIKIKARAIEDPFIRFQVWCEICKVAPEQEHLQEAMGLMEQGENQLAESMTYVQFYELTNELNYLEYAYSFIDHGERSYSKDLVWLRIIKAKANHGLIEEAKINVNKIHDVCLTSLAWIAIWKCEKTVENLQNMCSHIVKNKESEKAKLWLKAAKAIHEA